LALGFQGIDQAEFFDDRGMQPLGKGVHILAQPYQTFAHCAHRVLVGAMSDAGLVVLLLDPQAAGVTLTAMKTSSYEQLSLLVLDNVLVPATDVLAGPQHGAEVMRCDRA
jgi:hypothetical protein